MSAELLGSRAAERLLEHVVMDLNQADYQPTRRRGLRVKTTPLPELPLVPGVAFQPFTEAARWNYDSDLGTVERRGHPKGHKPETCLPTT